MSLDRKVATQRQDSGPQPDQDSNFLCLSPENLNRSYQHLNRPSNHHHHHKKNELVTRTSIESRETDSSSGSKKHGQRSRSPSKNRTKKHHKDNSGSPGGKSRHSSHTKEGSEKSSNSEDRKRARRHRKRRDVEDGLAESVEAERSRATCVVAAISTTIIVIAVLLVVVTLYLTPHFEDYDRDYPCCNNTEDFIHLQSKP